jgi:molybdenum cofactor biosynthesis enzyme MoaA
MQAEVCESSINTNLSTLDDERLQKIMNSSLTIINVSLDAATGETYRKIRGFSLDKVIKNIEHLILDRRRRRRDLPIIYLNMTLMRSNIEELKDFIQLAKRLGVDGVHLWHLNRWTDAVMARYVVERDGWTFNYAQEGLWNYPELSNRCLTEALDLAKNLGLPIYLDDHNKGVFF